MIRTLEDLVADPQNANLGTERGEQLLDYSLSTYGAGRGIVTDAHGLVIAGNKTLAMAIEKGLRPRVVHSDGTRLVVVQRADLDLADPETRALAYLDNRAAEVGLKWDTDQLTADLASGLDLGTLFLDHERHALIDQARFDAQDALALRTTLHFDTAAQAAHWARAVHQIANSPGSTFPQQLDAWLDLQLAALEKEVDRDPSVATIITPVGDP